VYKYAIRPAREVEMHVRRDLVVVLVAVVLAMAAAVSPLQAQQSNPGRGTQGGDPPPDGEKDPDIETRSSGTGSYCPYHDAPGSSQPSYLLYMDCVANGGTGSGYVTVEVAQGSAYPHAPEPLLHYETTLNGGAPPDMCICERSVDMRYTSVEIQPSGQVGDPARVGKIRKFWPPVAPEGGQVTIYINAVTCPFDTYETDTAAGLNQKLKAAIQICGFQVNDNPADYVVISPQPRGEPLARVGFHSTDPGLYRSEISIEPASFGNSLACAASSNICGEQPEGF
jgi:hypothetical protein